jgi:hypothetical protein
MVINTTVYGLLLRYLTWGETFFPLLTKEKHGLYTLHRSRCRREGGFRIFNFYERYGQKYRIIKTVRNLRRHLSSWMRYFIRRMGF